MYIANATGCSSIWGNSSPSTPYTMNKAGKGPAWDNSLFEDNAEFGYGMLLAQNAIRDGLKGKVEAVMAAEQATDEVKAACKEWLDTYGIGADVYKRQALLHGLAHNPVCSLYFVNLLTMIIITDLYKGRNAHIFQKNP